MSSVANVILSIEGLDFDTAQKCQEINAYFDKAGIRGFVSLEDPQLPKGWYGGTKYLEADLYLGAFNHLDLNSLVSFIKGISWPGPTTVQLLVKGQEQTLFTSIVVVHQGWDA
jgi:hypothetical protein